MSASASPEQWREAGRTYRHRGHDVFWLEHSHEPHANTALLLIHGFPTSSWDWHRMWDDLVRLFPRVLAADLLGFGFSDKPAGHAYSIREQADVLEALVTRCGIQRLHVLAHDYGDTVAQELLARHLERNGAGLEIVSCVLLNGGLFPEVHRARTIQKLLLTPLGPLLGRLMNRRSFGKSFAAIFGARTQPTERELDEFWRLIERGGGRRVMHRLIRYIPERRKYRERWVGALQKTPVPLRFINGPDDPVSGAHMVERYRELVPQPDVVTLPGIGHYPQTEAPVAVLGAFREFHAQRVQPLRLRP